MEHGYKALNQGTYYSYFVPQFAEFGIPCGQLSWVNTYGKPDHENHRKAAVLLRQGYYLIALMGPGTVDPLRPLRGGLVGGRPGPDLRPGLHPI